MTLMERVNGCIGLSQDADGPKSSSWIDRPGLACLLCGAIVLFIALGLKWVEKDPSVDAFVPADHPAALTRAAAQELFALEDPLVLGMVARDGASLFTPDVLRAFRRMASQIAELPGVEGDGLVSVLSESAILGASGNSGDLQIERIVPDGDITGSSARLAHERFMSMPMMLGLLGSADGSTLTMIVPVDDPNDSVAIYRAVLAIAQAEAPDDVTAHVAGVAAMNAGLAWMVDTDTRVFVPAAVFVVLIVLFLSLRSWRAIVGPAVVIAGSTAIAVGALGWLGGRYYLITTALPVVVMAMAVADSLHLSAFYLRARRLDPFGDRKRALDHALRHTRAPIAFTSITTTAGFLGLVIGSQMQPIREFGLFAAIGVLGAWLLSVKLLPAVILLLRVEPRDKLVGASDAKADFVVQRITQFAFGRPIYSLVLMASALLVMAWAGQQAQFDYQRQHYFEVDNPVRIADSELNARLDGLNFLDVVVAAPADDGLISVAAMQSMDQLQEELRQIDGVERVTSIVDYMKTMHGALSGEVEQLPQRQNAPAQYMFLYEASGSPEDYEEEIDYEYRHALLRAQLKTDAYQETRIIVSRFKSAISRFNATHTLQAEVSGRVAVNEGWMSLLAANHFVGLAIALILVAASCFIAFRNAWLTTLAMLPVFTGVLFVYALMGLANIDLAPATSMTSAIATGLGADFGIHLIAHIRREQAAGATLSEALDSKYLLIGRACLYSAIALTSALLVVCLSSAPPLRWFGALVAAGTLGSLFGALFLIPACLGWNERRGKTIEFAHALGRSTR